MDFLSERVLRKRECNLDHAYSTILNSRGRPLDARGCLCWK